MSYVITTFLIFWVFVVSSNKDAKVLLKQMTKFLGNSKYNVSLKKTLGGCEKFKKTLRRWEKFFLMKIDIYIYIYIYGFMWILPVLTPFFPILGQFFQEPPHLACYWLAGCILGLVSDKYSYLLKPCCNYIFQVSIIFKKF